MVGDIPVWETRSDFESELWRRDRDGQCPLVSNFSQNHQVQMPQRSGRGVTVVSKCKVIDCCHFVTHIPC